MYSSVPNRRVGQNNVQVEKVLKNIKSADPNKAVQGYFFLKINKHAGQILPIKMQKNKTVQGEIFSQN